VSRPRRRARRNDPAKDRYRYGGGAIAQQVLSVPVHAVLTGTDISRIVVCVRENLE
jgi:hypothetical protein